MGTRPLLVPKSNAIPGNPRLFALGGDATQRAAFRSLELKSRLRRISASPALQAGGHWFEPSTAHSRKAAPDPESQGLAAAQEFEHFPSGFALQQLREQHIFRSEDRLHGVEERVVRRHPFLSPLRQAIPDGAALAVWKVDRRGRPAFNRFHLDRLALPRSIL